MAFALYNTLAATAGGDNPTTRAARAARSGYYTASITLAIGVTIPLAGGADDSLTRTFARAPSVCGIAVRLAATGDNTAVGRVAFARGARCAVPFTGRRRSRDGEIFVRALHSRDYRPRLGTELFGYLTIAHAFAAHGQNAVKSRRSCGPTACRVSDFATG